MTDVDREVCGELRAEAARRNLTRGGLEDLTGIKRTRLRETVYSCDRSLLISELEILCEVLGLTMSEVVARAETAAARNVAPLLPLPGPGQPHPGLPSVTRYAEDEPVAAEHRDGTDEGIYDGA